MKSLGKSPLIRVVVLGLLVLGSAGVSHARVFTTKPPQSTIDDPASFAAKEIYGGKFRINGHPAQMKILAGSTTVQNTIQMLSAGTAGAEVRFRASQGTVVGAVGKGDSERRFLIASAGVPNSCLVFVLDGGKQAFSRTDAPLSWPKSLPSLDVAQQIQLVVEHLETDFIFAQVMLPQPSVEIAIQSCQQRLEGDGWEIEPLTEHGGISSTSATAILHKNGRTCWLEARFDPIPRQVAVTLLCKAS